LFLELRPIPLKNRQNPLTILWLFLQTNTRQTDRQSDAKTHTFFCGGSNKAAFFAGSISGIFPDRHPRVRLSVCGRIYIVFKNSQSCFFA